MNTDGLVIFDKPTGWTSHQVVGRLRRLLGTRKVGHAGTLDPMATGVLVVGVNRATRLLGHLALHDKRYLATIRLGQATTTDDAEGDPLAGAVASHLCRDVIETQIAKFRGDISQVPSSVSAIKVSGKRAYDLVRSGHEVELAARQVSITRYDLLGLRAEAQFLDLDIDVECTSGTYIRALARDLGKELGVGGHLTRLRRTRVGVFGLDSVSCSGIESDDCAVRVISMATVAELCFATVTVDEAIAKRIRFGQTVPVQIQQNPTAMVGPTGEFLALYRPDQDVARPVAVLG